MLVEPMGSWRTCVQLAPQCDLCQDSSTSFVYHHHFINNSSVKIVSFCALSIFEMVFHFGEVEGGISFRHLSRIDFSRAYWMVIHCRPSLGEYTKQGITLDHHRCTKSKKSWSNFLKNMMNWVWALPCDTLSTLTRNIQSERVVGVLHSHIWFHPSKNKILRPNSEPSEGIHVFTLNLNSWRHPTLTTHLGNTCLRFCTHQPPQNGQRKQQSKNIGTSTPLSNI